MAIYRLIPVQHSICFTYFYRTPVTFESRLRASLFANVNRSIDELYQVCEEECDEQMCCDAMNLFERSGRDFRLLTDRIDEQTRFGLDKRSSAWEVPISSNEDMTMSRLDWYHKTIPITGISAKVTVL